MKNKRKGKWNIISQSVSPAWFFTCSFKNPKTKSTASVLSKRGKMLPLRQESEPFSLQSIKRTWTVRLANSSSNYK